LVERKAAADKAAARSSSPETDMNEWDKATAKARDLVRMSVMRAAPLEPFEEITIGIHPASLVI
jgi:heterodisulfide reductase subunit A-like polyferredoxin